MNLKKAKLYGKLVMLLLTIVILFYLVNCMSSLIEQIELLQSALDKKDNDIKLLENKLNERGWSEFWTKELLVKMVDNNRQSYYIRNEIMYYNQDMPVEEASYQAIWIYTWSIENNVHPYLTTAVLVQESKLRHIDKKGSITISQAGAKGIGQLMPVVERLYGVDADIFEENIKGTTLFLSDLQKMYPGSIEGILGHYNGGSRPYEKIRDYKETREFVASVRHIYESMVEKYS